MCPDDMPHTPSDTDDQLVQKGNSCTHFTDLKSVNDLCFVSFSRRTVAVSGRRNLKDRGYEAIE
jgi:hypothetical protein